MEWTPQLIGTQKMKKFLNFDINTTKGQDRQYH